MYDMHQIGFYSPFPENEDDVKRIYRIARYNNICRQQKAATYYDKKVLDKRLDVNDSVLILDTRHRSSSLQYKCKGSAVVRTAKHPAYEVEFDGTRRWVTIDTLKPYHTGEEPDETADENSNPQFIAGDTTSSSDDEDGQPPHRGGRRYQLRQTPSMAERLGDQLAH